MQSLSAFLLFFAYKKRMAFKSFLGLYSIVEKIHTQTVVDLARGMGGGSFASFSAGRDNLLGGRVCLLGARIRRKLLFIINFLITQKTKSVPTTYFFRSCTHIKFLKQMNKTETLKRTETVGKRLCHRCFPVNFAEFLRNFLAASEGIFINLLPINEQTKMKYKYIQRADMQFSILRQCFIFFQQSK